jgi:hypothetical protein
LPLFEFVELGDSDADARVRFLYRTFFAVVRENDTTVHGFASGRRWSISNTSNSAAEQLYSAEIAAACRLESVRQTLKKPTKTLGVSLDWPAGNP